MFSLPLFVYMFICWEGGSHPEILEYEKKQSLSNSKNYFQLSNAFGKPERQYSE